MSERKDSQDGERDEAEVLADRVRDELLITLRELDRRRHEAFDLRAQWALHRQQLLAAAGVLVGGIGLFLGAFAWRARRRHSTGALKRRRTRERAGARWSPEPFKLRPRRQRAMGGLLLNRVVMALALGVGTKLAQMSGSRKRMIAPKTPRMRHPASVH